MPPAIIDDEFYDENEDSDFAPDTVPTYNEEAVSDSSDSEPDIPPTTTQPKKRKRVENKLEEAEELGIENSGDEAIINTGVKEKRKAKKGKGKDGAAAEDSGGEGGVVKTRSMRAHEYVIISNLYFSSVLLRLRCGHLANVS